MLRGLLPTSIVCLTILFTVSCGDSELRRQVKGLDSDDANRRVDAIYQLAAMKGKESEVIPYLVRATADEAESVRVAAVSVLGSEGVQQVGNARVYQRLLKSAQEDSSPQVRAESVELLGRLYPDNEETVSTIVIALEDQDLMVATRSSEALIAMGPEAAGAASMQIAEVLKRVIKSEVESGTYDDPAGRGQTLAMGLAQQGGRASDAVPTLESIVSDTTLPKTIRDYVSDALKAMKGI